MYYITVANYQSLIEEFNIEKSVLAASFEELKCLLKITNSKFFENLRLESLITLDDNQPVDIYTKKNLKHDFKTIIRNSRPSYHLTIDCERLNSIFTDFKFPVELVHSDENTKRKFVKWFASNLKQIKLNKMKFKSELKELWNISEIPEKIIILNSGVKEIIYVTNENIIKDLKIIFKELDKFLNINKQFSIFINNNLDWIYKSCNNENWTLNLQKNIDNNLQKTFINKFVYPIKDLLIEYLKINLNDNIDPNKNILEQFGYSGCYKCTCDNRSDDLIDLLFN